MTNTNNCRTCRFYEQNNKLTFSIKWHAVPQKADNATNKEHEITTNDQQINIYELKCVRILVLLVFINTNQSSKRWVTDNVRPFAIFGMLTYTYTTSIGNIKQTAYIFFQLYHKQTT